MAHTHCTGFLKKPDKSRRSQENGTPPTLIAAARRELLHPLLRKRGVWTAPRESASDVHALAVGWAL